MGASDYRCAHFFEKVVQFILEKCTIRFCDYNWTDSDEHPVVLKKIRIVPMQDIIERSGSWIKTSIRDYRKALKKFNDCRRYYETLWNCNNRKNICRITSPEDCEDIEAQMEVFIEKV